MKLRKYVLSISFVLIFILAVGAVSASESDDSAFNIAGLADDEQIDVDVEDDIALESSADEEKIQEDLTDQSDEILAQDEGADIISNDTVLDGSDSENSNPANVPDETDVTENEIPEKAGSVGTDLTASDATALGSGILNSNHFNLSGIADAITDYVKGIDFNLIQILPTGLNITDFNFYIPFAVNSIVDFVNGKNFKFNVTDVSNALDKALEGTLLNGKIVLDIASQVLGGRDFNFNVKDVSSILDLILRDKGLKGKDVFDSVSKFINSPIFNSAEVIRDLDGLLNGTGYNGAIIIGKINDFLNGKSFNLNINKVSDVLDKLLNGTGFSGAGIIGEISEFMDGKPVIINITYVTDVLDKLSGRTGLKVPEFIQDLRNFIIKMNGLNMTDTVSGLINDVSKIAGAVVDNVFIKQTPTNLVATKVTTTFGTAKNLVITLIDTNGNPISGKAVVVELDGNLFSGVTNDAGKAAVAVPKNLVPKTYSATLKFAGDNRYAASTGVVKVGVAKATPKLAAKSKAFKKAVKIKKYAIVLKTDKNQALKNVKVTLKIKGKTFSAKTNSKGQAVFKITKFTKKGTFNSVVNFQGNKYYKAVSKKVTINIK
ncbi:Ig-like domain-containing protein [Methanobrevibacter sp.]